MYSDEEEDEDCDEKEQDDFVDLPPGVTRVVTTVPAKEPRLDAQPLKPALKQPKGSSRSQAGTPPSQNGRHHASTPPQDKHQKLFKRSEQYELKIVVYYKGFPSHIDD